MPLRDAHTGLQSGGRQIYARSAVGGRLVLTGCALAKRSYSSYRLQTGKTLLLLI